MRAVAIGIAVCVLVWIITAGHVFFLPLLFIPIGIFSLGERRSRRR
jgi:hypothetical protein